MADNTTKWILELVDKVTAPVRKVVQSVDSVTEGVEEVGTAVQMNEKDTKQALSNTKEWYDDVTDKIKLQERELKDLEKAMEEAAPGHQKQMAGEVFDQAKRRLGKLREELHSAEDDMQHLNRRLDEFGNNKRAWENVATGINQTIEMVERLGDSLNFTEEITDVRVQIQRMTDMSGDALDSATAKAWKLSKVVKESPGEIAKAAHALTQHVGGSFEENMALIEKGFEKGANINGDFLDQLREYPTFFKELGLDGSQAIAMIAQAGKKAIYSDKAIDSVKEAKLALSEMTKATRDALKGIGMKPRDLAGLNHYEQIQKVSQAMAGASEAAKSAVLADVFKGAGEDAGVAWVEGYASIDLDMDKIKSYKDAKSGLRGFVADIESSIGLATGSVGSYISELASFGTTILGLIGVFGPLMNAIRGTTAAQWLLNISMSMNPIGLIIAAIIALIALVTAIIVKYDEWGASLALLLGPLGWMINLIMSFKRHWDSIVEAFQSDGILAGLKRIGLVILDSLLMPLQQLLEIASKIPGIGDLAADGAEKIAKLRKSFELGDGDDKVNKPEKEGVEKPSAPDQDLLSQSTRTTPEIPTKEVEQEQTRIAALNKPAATQKGQAANVRQEVTFNLNFSLPESWRNELDNIADAVVEKLTGATKDAGGSVAYG